MLRYEHYAIGHNVTLREGALRQRDVEPLSDRARAKHRLDDRRQEASRLPAHDDRGAEDRRPFPTASKCSTCISGLSAWERSRQLGVLARSAEYEALDSGRACLIGGDFNDWRSLLHPVFTDVMRFECATHTDPDDERALRTYPSFSPRGDLDRIYHRGSVRAVAASTCRLPVSRVARSRPFACDRRLRVDRMRQRFPQGGRLIRWGLVATCDRSLNEWHASPSSPAIGRCSRRSRRTVRYFDELKPLVAGADHCEIVVCAPFPALTARRRDRTRLRRRDRSAEPVLGKRGRVHRRGVGPDDPRRGLQSRGRRPQRAPAVFR